MAAFTTLALTILLRGWRQKKQPFRPHLAFVRMQVKRTSRGGVFVLITAITTALWLNWKLHAGACQMIPTYSRRWLPSKGLRGAGKSAFETSSALLSSTRATLSRFSRPDLVTEPSGVMLNKNRSPGDKSCCHAEDRRLVAALRTRRTRRRRRQRRLDR